MLSKDNIGWIESHINDNPASLRLRYGNNDPEINKCILQIECGKKAAGKLKETLKDIRFEFPSLLLAEQCTGDVLASFHAGLVRQGENVADLTAGLGIDAFHFARKAESVTAVERDGGAASVLADNATVSGQTNVEVVNDDCTEYVKCSDRHFDTVFIDPARRGEKGEKLYKISDCSPDVTAMLPDLKKLTDRLLIKLSPMLDISSCERELKPYVKTVYALGTTTECKEILVDVSFAEVNEETYNPARVAVTVFSDGSHAEFGFTAEEDASSTLIYSEPKEADFILEPYPAVMKAAPWKILSEKFGLAALGANSHLYVSEKMPVATLGTVYKVREVMSYSSGEIKRFAKKYPEGSVAVRNFRMSADDLRRKLKVKDKSSPRIFATTLQSGAKIIIVCDKV